MKHLNEAELVEHYYEESANMADCERHLKVLPGVHQALRGVAERPRRCEAADAADAWRRLRRTSLAIHSRLFAGIRKAETNLDPVLATTRLGSRLRAADGRGLCCRAPVGAETDVIGGRGCRPASAPARSDRCSW